MKIRVQVMAVKITEKKTAPPSQAFLSVDEFSAYDRIQLTETISKRDMNIFLNDSLKLTCK
jgi:hypothetical protein